MWMLVYELHSNGSELIKIANLCVKADEFLKYNDIM
jgi:hypothetical protein